MAFNQATSDDFVDVSPAVSPSQIMNRPVSPCEPQHEYDGRSPSPVTEVIVDSAKSHAPRMSPRAGEPLPESYGEGSSRMSHPVLQPEGFIPGHHAQGGDSSKIIEDPYLSRPAALKPQFYRLRDEIDREGTLLGGRALRHGAFRSEVDPRHILRVVYSQEVPSPESTHPGDLPGGIKIWVIRINSEPITMFLEKIMETKLSTDSVVEFFAPFRPLVRNFEMIREQQALLEKKYSKEAVLQAPELGYETHLALVHFRVLIQFMEEYLGPSVRLYKQVQLGECDKIAYPDLWMLYDSDSLIYSEDSLIKRRARQHPAVDYFHSYHRMHRVLAVVGGIPLKRALERQANGDIPRPWDDKHPDRLCIDDMYSDIRVFCYTIDYDTKTWGACPVVFTFPPFEGEKEISSLAAYPIHNTHPLRSKVKERGEKFIKMTTVSHWEYDGLTMGNGNGFNIFHAGGQVVVDLMSAVRRGTLEFLNFGFEFDSYKRDWMPPKEDEVVEILRPGHTHTHIDRAGREHYPAPRDVYRETQMKLFHRRAERVEKLLAKLEEAQGSGDLTVMIDLMHKEEASFLLPATITGYPLRHRIWAKLDIDLLKPVSQTLRWDDLILPPGHKEMTQALIAAHFLESPGLSTSSKRGQSGLTGGKGKGCVILLHGPPGVGKTSTAEYAAAAAKRPCLRVSCGELGHHPAQLEANLEDVFDLASRWGCILIFEDADVFLMKRSIDNLSQNALTSVFLRVLRYFRGVLFLTTNHVGPMDNACRSRLHSMLYYPPLDKSKALQVWNLNIRRVKEQNETRIQDGKSEVLLKDDEILEFAAETHERLKWNGRQISNAFHTALALAEFKAHEGEKKESVVGKDEFQTVADSLKLAELDVPPSLDN